MFAAVAVFFTACTEECNHEFIEVDYSKTLVGTWTCLEEDYAAAFVFNADGTAFTTGVENGEYWENVQVNWKVVNNKLTLSYEDNTSETLLEIIPGEYLSISDKNGDRRKTYKYCENDLVDEIVGMWVCNDGLTDGMTIMSYSANGKSTMTTAAALGTSDPLVNRESDYIVVGDLVFIALPTADAVEAQPIYTPARMIYTPNGTSAGDIMTHKKYVPTAGGLKESQMSFLRIKQYLDLAGMKYDYIKTFVTNVKGEDKDIEFMGYTFNFAKMDGYVLDKMLKTVLFAVQFPDANTIRYTCQYNDFNMVMDAPIDVDGNKMTVKMSQRDAAYKDVDLYTFQDQDNTQMHMYMPTYAFINFFANMQIAFMSELGEIDKTDAAAVKAVFDSIDNAVETINVSFVMTKAQR